MVVTGRYWFTTWSVLVSAGLCWSRPRPCRPSTSAAGVPPGLEPLQMIAAQCGFTTSFCLRLNWTPHWFILFLCRTLCRILCRTLFSSCSSDSFVVSPGRRILEAPTEFNLSQVVVLCCVVLVLLPVYVKVLWFPGMVTPGLWPLIVCCVSACCSVTSWFFFFGTFFVFIPWNCAGRCATCCLQVQLWKTQTHKYIWDGNKFYILVSGSKNLNCVHTPGCPKHWASFTLHKKQQHI